MTYSRNQFLPGLIVMKTTKRKVLAHLHVPPIPPDSGSARRSLGHLQYFKERSDYFEVDAIGCQLFKNSRWSLEQEKAVSKLVNNLYIYTTNTVETPLSPSGKVSVVIRLVMFLADTPQKNKTCMIKSHQADSFCIQCLANIDNSLNFHDPAKELLRSDTPVLEMLENIGITTNYTVMLLQRLRILHYCIVLLGFDQHRYRFT